MPKIDVYSIEGKKVKEVELNEAIFGIEPNEAVVHSVLVNFLANQRQGTQSTKTSSKLLENQLVVVDKLDMKEIKTKEMVNVLNNLKVEGKTLMLLPEKNENVQKSARNIEGVKTTLVNTINVYDLLKYKNLVITLDTVKKLEEVYA